MRVRERKHEVGEIYREIPWKESSILDLRWILNSSWYFNKMVVLPDSCINIFVLFDSTPTLLFSFCDYVSQASEPSESVQPTVYSYTPLLSVLLGINLFSIITIYIWFIWSTCFTSCSIRDPESFSSGTKFWRETHCLIFKNWKNKQYKAALDKALFGVAKNVGRF